MEIGGCGARRADTDGIATRRRLPYDPERVECDAVGAGMLTVTSKGGYDGCSDDGLHRMVVKWPNPSWCNAGSALFENLPS